MGRRHRRFALLLPLGALVLAGCRFIQPVAVPPELISAGYARDLRRAGREARTLVRVLPFPKEDETLPAGTIWLGAASLAPEDTVVPGIDRREAFRELGTDLARAWEARGGTVFVAARSDGETRSSELDALLEGFQDVESPEVVRYGSSVDPASVVDRIERIADPSVVVILAGSATTEILMRLPGETIAEAVIAAEFLFEKTAAEAAERFQIDYALTVDFGGFFARLRDNEATDSGEDPQFPGRVTRY